MIDAACLVIESECVLDWESFLGFLVGLEESRELRDDGRARCDLSQRTGERDGRGGLE